MNPRPVGVASGEGEKAVSSIRLIRFTMIVYHQEQPDEPLVTLTRYLPPPEFEGSGR